MKKRPHSFLNKWLAPIAIGAAILACGAGAAEVESFDPEEAPAEEPARPEATEPAALPTANSPTEEVPDSSNKGENEDLPVMQTLPEERLITFEWPQGIRVGDADILRLSLIMNEDGTITPTAVFDDHELLGQPLTIDNLYDTHLVRAEARLDLAGAEVEPTGTVMQRMLPGEPVVFTWSISPREQGTIRGNVWMFVRYIPIEPEQNVEIEKLIFTQPLEIQAQNFLGLGGTPARALGIIGVIISSLIGLDDVFRIARKVVKI